MDSPAKHFTSPLLSSCIDDKIYLIILKLSLVRLGCEQEILKGGKEYSDTWGGKWEWEERKEPLYGQQLRWGLIGVQLRERSWRVYAILKAREIGERISMEHYFGL